MDFVCSSCTPIVYTFFLNSKYNLLIKLIYCHLRQFVCDVKYSCYHFLIAFVFKLEMDLFFPFSILQLTNCKKCPDIFLVSSFDWKENKLSIMSRSEFLHLKNTYLFSFIAYNTVPLTIT